MHIAFINESSEVHMQMLVIIAINTRKMPYYLIEPCSVLCLTSEHFSLSGPQNILLLSVLGHKLCIATVSFVLAVLCGFFLLFFSPPTSVHLRMIEHTIH